MSSSEPTQRRGFLQAGALGGVAALLARPERAHAAKALCLPFIDSGRGYPIGSVSRLPNVQILPPSQALSLKKNIEAHFDGSDLYRAV